jgi:hypothetical protein
MLRVDFSSLTWFTLVATLAFALVISLRAALKCEVEEGEGNFVECLKKREGG